MHGTYVGPFVTLKGQTALLRETGVEGRLLAQFDDPLVRHPSQEEHRPDLLRQGENSSRRRLGFGWTPFDATDFQIDKET